LYYFYLFKLLPCITVNKASYGTSMKW